MKTISIGQLAESRDDLVLCSTARLSQSLRERHARACQQSGRSQWTPLDCRTVDQWLSWLNEEMSLRGLATDPAFACLALDGAQERLLWERVILEGLGDGADLLFDVGAMARIAAQAHALTVTWKVVCDEEQASDETRQFR